MAAASIFSLPESRPTESDSAKEQLFQSIKDMHMEEADYFVENFAHLYGKTLDELTV